MNKINYQYIVRQICLFAIALMTVAIVKYLGATDLITVLLAGIPVCLLLSTMFDKLFYYLFKDTA